MNQPKELTKDLLEIMKYENYRGCIVEKLHEGYKVFGIPCDDLRGVDKVIDNAGTVITKSIAVESPNAPILADNDQRKGIVQEGYF